MIEKPLLFIVFLVSILQVNIRKYLILINHIRYCETQELPFYGILYMDTNASIRKEKIDTS